MSIQGTNIKHIIRKAIRKTAEDGVAYPHIKDGRVTAPDGRAFELDSHPIEEDTYSVNMMADDGEYIEVSPYEKRYREGAITHMIRLATDYYIGQLREEFVGEPRERLEVKLPEITQADLDRAQEFMFDGIPEGWSLNSDPGEMISGSTMGDRAWIVTGTSGATYIVSHEGDLAKHAYIWNVWKIEDSGLVLIDSGGSKGIPIPEVDGDALQIIRDLEGVGS